MSTPVDIPQNINIHVSHLDKVVEAPKTNVAENSADRSSLEMSNKEPEHKHLVTKKDKEKEKEKEKKRNKDHFEKQTFQNQQDKKHNLNDQGPDASPEDKKTANNSNVIGKKIDFSV